MNETQERSQHIAVVVVTYNSAALLEDLVASLGDGLAPLRWSLVVVDNASTDDTVSVARQLAPEATVVETGHNAGYAAGINAGVAAAEPHDAVLVLNPDVRLAPGCVSALVGALAGPGVGIAVPRLIDARGDLIESMRREPSVARAWADAILGARRAGRWAGLGEMVSDHRRYSHEQLTDWAEGSTQLVSSECWRRCGPWDETYFLYSEETDFNLRARDAGLAVRFVPSATARHLEGGSGSSPALWALLVANRVRLFSRRHNRSATAAFWAAVVTRECTRSALGRRNSTAAVRALLSPRRLREPRGPAWLSP